MDESGQQNTNPQQPTNQPELSHRKVILPSEDFKRELEQSRPATPTGIVASQFVQARPPMPDQPKPIISHTVAPPADHAQAYGISASQMALNQQKRRIAIDWMRLLRKSLMPLVVLVLIVGGFVFYKSYTGFATKIVSNYGYTYRFKFYRNSTPIKTTGGVNVYKHADNIIAGVEPRDATLNAYCAEIGGVWTEAFTVQVYGTTRPICAANNEDFTMEFSALNHNHLFTVVYNGQQDSSVYPTLKTIFSSVKVSQ